MQDENAKMDFGSHLFGVAFLPKTITSAISLFAYSVQKCCLDVPDRPRLMRISSSLTSHSGGVRGRPSRPESWFFACCSSWDLLLKKLFFLLEQLPPYSPCPRLPHSPPCKPHSLQSNSWCSSAFNFNPADIFPAEALIPSRISSPLVPRNEQ